MKLFRSHRRFTDPFRSLRGPAVVPVDRFASAARSHEGAVREINEDRFLDAAEVRVWAVADGMGGHLAGDVAAQMTIDAIAALLEDGQSPAPAAVHEAVGAVSDRLSEALRRGGLDAASGSTIVILLVAKGSYTCLWAGDSRVYLGRGGALIPITRDHSLVQEMVDAGVIAPADARGHPRANVITRAVGVVDRFELEAATGSIVPGDRFLLCSDGLTEVLGDDEIGDLLFSGDVHAAADALFNTALQRQPRDNVTLVLVDALG